MNYYEILGLKQSATQAEIKAAYKALVKKYHPDVYRGDKTFAEKKTQEINEAYTILSVPETKAEYDEFLNPTPTYDYTPPKYDNPESYTTSYSTYEKYKNSNYNNYNNNYNNFYSKYYNTSNYSSAYTNNYNNNSNKSTNNYYEKVYNKENTVPSSTKVKVVLMIIIVYIFFMIMTFSQVSSLLSGTKSGTILDVTEDTSPTMQNSIYENNKYNFQPDNNYEYNFEEIITEEELYTIYLNAFTGTFRSFEEFKLFFEENYHYIEEYYAPKRNQNTLTNSATNSISENTTITSTSDQSDLEIPAISEDTNMTNTEEPTYYDFYYQGLPQFSY